LRLRLSSILALAILAAAGQAAAQPPTYHVVAKIPLPDGGWDLATFDPVLRRVYLARNEAVTAVDVDTGKVTGRLAPANHGHTVVPLKGGTEILVTNSGGNTADIFDARSGAALATIAAGQKPDAAMFDAATGLAVVMNGKSGDLTLIDPQTRKSVGQIAVGGALELGAGDGKGRLFVNVEDRNEVAVVDLKARKVVAHIPLTGCDGPTGLAYLPVSRKVVSSCVNGVATVADPATGKVERTFPIGQRPDSVLYDAKRRIAFIPAGGSEELDLFADDANGVRALGKVASHAGARTGAVDDKTGRVYLPAADYAPATAGGHAQMKPGSAFLLVLEP
jgi:DNA-binding beta-propeller fold protein YncE